MKTTRTGFVFLCLIALGLALSGAGPSWKTFASTKHRYSVRYPASWYLFSTPLAPELDSLDILNFPPEERVHGVILKKSGARIMVGPVPAGTRTVEQWIKESTKFHTEVVQREIREFRRNPSGCKDLKEVTSLEEEGPGAYLGVTSYYCETTYGLYGVTLLNWKGDPNQYRLRATALKIALSLRSW